jgi:putative transposase
VLLRREGWRVNSKRVYRLYREMSLQLRNKIPKRRVKAKLREGRQSATRANRPGRWTLSMISWRPDASCACSRSSTRFSRYSPAIEPRFTLRGADVVEILEEVGRQEGFPKTIRVDQGTEFVSRDLDLWAY